ncbi:MAG: MFS transporter [Pirellulales bacterium]|nr:MFS transporter [Pirellulales bacterium]
MQGEIRTNVDGSSWQADRKQEAGVAGRLRSVVRALGHRNYRLFFFGQSVSLIGTWMQQTAMIWLVYRLSDSPWMLGLVGFSGQIPAFLLAPLAGVLTDRWNRHRTLVVTQTLAMLHAILFVALIGTGVLAVWHLIVLAVALGMINALDMPTRQAFVVDMVGGREDLSNAIALNSVLFNAARLLGPAAAGFLIGLIGEWMCMLINGLSYLAVLAALAAMRIEPRGPAGPAGPARPVWSEFREGLAYAVRFRPILTLLLLLGLTSFTAMPLTVLMPVFAVEILRGGPQTLGLLTAAMGAGALSGGLMLASRRSVLGLGRVICIASAAIGVGMIGFALSRSLWLSLSVVAVTGLAMIVQMAASNTVLQTIVDEDKRGRVMSFYIMAFMGTAPLGSLLSGALASRYGAPIAVAACGLVSLAGAAVFAYRLPHFRELVRPVYIRQGILPEVSSGVGVTTELTVPPED